MATASTSVGLKIPAYFPNNQIFPATTGDIYTDTHTLPATSAPTPSIAAISFASTQTRQSLLKKRVIQVATKVFRTDFSSAGYDASVYTQVTEDQL